MNTNAVRTVRDKFGNVVTRANGALLDGDDEIVRDGESVRAPMMLADAASTIQDTSRRLFINDTTHRGGVHTAAMRVLGDAYNAADYAGLTDEAVRHAVVRRKLGDAAAGRSIAFLDAAWATLAGVPGGAAASAPPAASHGMTDAQRAVAAAGIEAALADHAKRGGVADGAPRFKVQDRAVAVAAYDEMRRTISDGWKTPEQRALDAGSRADAAANSGVDPRLLVDRAYQEMCTRTSNAWKGNGR